MFYYLNPKKFKTELVQDRANKKKNTAVNACMQACS